MTTAPSVPSWLPRLITVGATQQQANSIQAGYMDSPPNVQAALDTIVNFVDNTGLTGMLTEWAQGNQPFAYGLPGGGLPFGSKAALLTGNTSDDVYAISAGTGQKLNVGGGGSGNVTDRGAWAATTTYSVHDLVEYGGTVWLCAVAHTSGSSFDQTKFTELNTYRGAWQASTEYNAGDTAVSVGAIWTRITQGISSSTWSADASNWTELAGSTAGLLQSANNLSDVADTGSSRANLRVPALTPAQCVATSNISSLSALQTIDGYTLVAGDLVLLTGQSTSSQNGLWAAASGAWTRPTEFPSGGVVKGRTCAVINGTTNARTLWLLSITTGSIVIDTGAQTWNKLGATTSLSVTDGTNTVTAVTSLSFAGAAVSGSTGSATVTTAPVLVPTAKSAAYNANAWDFVEMTGAHAVTLPNAPATGSEVGLVSLTSQTSFVASGSDVISYNNQVITTLPVQEGGLAIVIYVAGTWYVFTGNPGSIAQIRPSTLTMYNGASGSPTMTVSSSAQVGDLLVAMGAGAFGLSSVPSGWTNNATNGTGYSGYGGWVCTKRCVSADIGANYTFGLNNSAVWGACIMAVEAVQVIRTAAASQNGVSGTSYTGNTATGGVTGDLVLTFAGFRTAGATVSLSSTNTTNQVDQGNITANGTLSLWTSQLTSILGTTPTVTETGSANSATTQQLILY